MTKSEIRRLTEQAKVYQPTVKDEEGNETLERPDLPDLWRVDASTPEGGFTVDVHAKNAEEARSKALETMLLNAID